MTLADIKSKKNLFLGDQEKEFCLWVDPKNFITFNNLVITGHAHSNPIPPETDNPEDNLLFIPNPRHKGFITPYHNNIIKRIRAEYILETTRPRGYPPRIHALFLFDTPENALRYKEIHESHIKERILIQGTSTGNYLYSTHDSGWFDFLCMDASIGPNAVSNSANSYWNGTPIVECKLQRYGHSWSQPATVEVLFYGNLKISENSKKEISEEFKKAYYTTPWNYPKMHLS